MPPPAELCHLVLLVWSGLLRNKHNSLVRHQHQFSCDKIDSRQVTDLSLFAASNFQQNGHTQDLTCHLPFTEQIDVDSALPTTALKCSLGP